MKNILVCFLVFFFGLSQAVADTVAWPTVSNLKQIDAKNVYDRPYSLSENKIDSTILYRNTGALVGISIATMGLLYLMPSSFTHWDSEDTKNPGSKWWKNVSHAPVWDKDDIFLNYVTHPYAGAIYYMGARSAGANAAYSFLYSFALSTFFWEYGIESLAERPSIQDLIVTPIFGSLLGEGFYLAKRSILDNNGQLWGSRTLGKIAIFLMDPMTEITSAIFDDSEKEKNFSFSSQPYLSRHGSLGYGIHLKVSF